MADTGVNPYSPPFNNVPDCYVDVFVVLACVRLRGLAPAPVEQDGGGCHARCVIVAVAMIAASERTASLYKTGTATGCPLVFSLLAKVYGVDTPPVGAGKPASGTATITRTI